MKNSTQSTQEFTHCRELIYQLNAGVKIQGKLARQATREALAIEDASTRHYFLSAICHGLLIAGPTAEQIIGMLEASFSFDTYNPKLRPPLVENTTQPTITIMGSGKKGLKTVNISTLSAIVASSSKKLIVAKPCTEAVASLTGSADFINVLGITAHKDARVMQQIVHDTGLGLFFVNSYMPRFMSRYDGVFYAPHAMSYALAGLVLPYKTDSLLYGVALPNAELGLEIFDHYGVSNPTIVSSTTDGVHFVDEALPVGTTTVSSLQAKKPVSQHHAFEHVFGGSPPSLESFSPVLTNNKHDNVMKGLHSIIPGKLSDLGKTIALNAGLILQAAGVVNSISDGYVQTSELIVSGAAWRQLENFTEVAGGSAAFVRTLV
jgi:anthranilate phosphoribosyltransferase